MSALEVFVRVRQFKARAAEYFELAAQPESEEVRARYLAIADHYMALAEGELRADRLARRKRLDQMRAEREKSQRTGVAPDRHSAADAKADAPPPLRPAGPAKLRVIEGTKRPGLRGRGRLQMAAQAQFAVIKAAP
jgi:hypothetical protein